MIQNDLRRLVNDYGHPVTLRRVATGSYNPATGAVSSTTLTDTEVKAYFYNYGLTAIYNENIVFGDRRIVFPLYDVDGLPISEPVVGDQVMGNGNTVNIIATEKILDRGVVTCYLCQVRE